MKNLINRLFSTSPAKRKARRRQGTLLRTQQLETRKMMAADSAQPVLMVISNQDFYYQEYADTRQSIEAAGLEVVVAATTTDTATPHGGSGQGASSGEVEIDQALANVDAANYSAIVIVGGWGSSQYQYEFPGDYSYNYYDGTEAGKETFNDLVGDFAEQDKHIAAICHGVTVLAWARVDGESPLNGVQVSIPYIGSPAGVYNGQWYSNFELGQYEQVVANGATANLASGQYGDPNTAHDDVIVDGRIITAENYDSAAYFGEVIAQEVYAAADTTDDEVPTSEDPVDDDTVDENPNDETPTGSTTSAQPVLMVISNQDFYYQEYADTRQSIEAAGLEVVVAAATTDTATPHGGSGQGASSGEVEIDQALANVDAANYSAIVIVGGWGSSQYQYEFPGDYSYNYYDGTEAGKETFNDLVGDFAEQDKHIAAICHGVTVLAWARVDGESPLNGVQVSIPYIGSPAGVYNGQWYSNFELGQYEQVVANGATANLASGQYGDPNTAHDDVIVDGRIITAENYDSAAYFGEVIAQEVYAAAEAPVDEDPVNEDPVEEDPVDDTPPETATLPAGFMGMVANDFVINGTSQADTIYIWSGADGSVFAWQNGTQSGPHTLGENGSVIAFAGSGNDTIYATDAHAPVVVFGEAGNDHMTGGTVSNILDGGSGNDRLKTFEGAAVMLGGAGNDQLRGGASNDQLLGALSIDVSTHRSGDDLLIINNGDGSDFLAGLLAADLLNAGSSADSDLLDAGEGNDLLIGGDGADVLRGGSGNDILLGGRGYDIMLGQDGNDLLLWNNGDGSDCLQGGEGVDRIVSGTDDSGEYDTALDLVLGEWNQTENSADRTASLAEILAAGGTAYDFDGVDHLCQMSEDLLADLQQLD